ncbi:MAG: NAD(P)-dependent oxidoreductase [Polyangiaceae bacterium]|nr:NAD(P)-dependent oxidoreductase [Polyangiaceae bacterium]MCB9608241.1 NAD(P)-dependent oxidoreductase [Polyangiaceae bacterium]
MSGRVIVTGASGWLGRRLVAALLHGLPGVPPFENPPALAELVIGIHSADAALEEWDDPRVRVVKGDLRDPDYADRLCRDGDGSLLLHTAGLIHPRRVKDFYAVNTQGTQRVLEVAEQQGVRRAVVVSSNSPVGCNASPEALFDEATPFNPYMGYGRSKMLMEQATLEIQERGKLQTVLVRPPWFYGPYQPPRQTLFFEMIRAGRVPIVGNGENLRSMVYIDNLCQGLLRAAAVPHANGRVYWIADAEPYPMNRIVDTVERLMETEFGFQVAHKRLRLPGFAGEVATLLDGALQRVGVYQQKLHVLGEMNKHIACSVAKARLELGYTPTVALEEGMRRSIQYCIDQGLLRP